MWDSHIMIGSFFVAVMKTCAQLFFFVGGAAGTNLEKAQCVAGSDSEACMAAFLGLHLTCASTAYLEVSSSLA